MEKDNFGLISFVGQALAASTGYVCGKFGQCCTTALLDQKARQYPADDLLKNYNAVLGITSTATA